MIVCVSAIEAADDAVFDLVSGWGWGWGWGWGGGLGGGIGLRVPQAQYASTEEFQRPQSGHFHEDCWDIFVVLDLVALLLSLLFWFCVTYIDDIGSGCSCSRYCVVWYESRKKLTESREGLCLYRIKWYLTKCILVCQDMWMSLRTSSLCVYDLHPPFQRRFISYMINWRKRQYAFWYNLKD